MQGALCTVSVFFYILLIWGAYAPPAYRPGVETQKTNQPRFIWMTSTNTEVIKLSIINA